MSTKRLVTDATCIALNIILSEILALNLGPMKLSFSGFPIILTAMMFGPVDGFLVGLLGGLVGQLIGPYGISLTTPLWIMPAAFIGIVVGIAAKYTYRYEYTAKASLAVVLFLALFIDTTLTTCAMYVDCMVYRYSFAAYSPYILWRYVADVIKAPVYAMLAPTIVNAVRLANA